MKKKYNISTKVTGDYYRIYKIIYGVKWYISTFDWVTSSSMRSICSQIVWTKDIDKARVFATQTMFSFISESSRYLQQKYLSEDEAQTEHYRRYRQFRKHKP